MDRHVPSHSAVPGLTSLILPTYNPGPGIRQIWNAVKQFVQRSPAAWEVLFVCDGSTDGSTQQLTDLSERENDRYRVIACAKNRGKGHAVRKGLAQARGQWRIFTDVDLSYGLDGVQRVAENLRRGESVVIGSRLMEGACFVIPASLQDYAYKRRIQSHIYSAVARFLLPIPQRDTQAGLKGFSAQVVEKMLPFLHCDGFSFDCELLLACYYLGCHVHEIPVQFVYRDRTTTNFRKSLQMIRDLCMIRSRFARLIKETHSLPKPRPVSQAA